MSDENDDSSLDVLRLQAMYFALETLCIALVNTSTNKLDVIARFEAHRMALENKVLHDPEIHDVVLDETLRAHAAIADLLSPSGNPL